MDNEAGRRSSALRALLELHDEAFVRRAYQVVLGREADAGGLAHAVARLREGDDRLALIAALRLSTEGRGTGIHHPELDALIAPYRRAAHPVWGKLRKARGVHRLSADRRRANILENRLARAGGGERPDDPPPPPAASRAIASLPSRKVTGNVALPARAWSERPRIERILLIKLDHLGDFFVAVRALSLIREAWPQARLTLVCGSWNVPLAERLGLFDEILPLDLPIMKPIPEGDGNWIGQCAPIAALPLGRYDLAVDLRWDMDTRPCLLFVEAAFKAGYEDRTVRPWPGGACPVNIALPQSDLHAELRCTMLAQLVITTLCPPDEHPIRALVRDGGTGLPFADETYLVVCPGAAVSNRRWRVDRWIELLRAVREDEPFGVVLAGSTHDRADAARIAASLPDGASVNRCGAPLDELPAILAGAAMFIGCDSGPGHLAALLGTPTLSLYAGVSDPEVWQPLGPRVAVVHSRTPCAYCHEKRCDYGFRCMEEVTVRDAVAQFRALRATPSPRLKRLNET